MKIKNGVYIGKDSLGFIAKLDIYKDNDRYNFRVNILRDEEDKNLEKLKENLEKIISIKEESNRVNINLNVNKTVRL